jgi:hypothetical protein
MVTPAGHPSGMSSEFGQPSGLLRRRDFLVSVPAGVAAAAAAIGYAPGAPAPRPGRKWYSTAWRRAVIDMHIPDWDEAFLSRFDPDEYVGALVKARAQSVVCYAHSHVGLFLYPTKVGRQHRGLKGRNLVQEIIERCRRRGIAVVLYGSVVYDRWAFDEHPEWREIRYNGEPVGGEGKRYGMVCLNSPYRDYVQAWAREWCELFDFDGIRFDMTFWVGVCYCAHCRRRFAAEVGGEMPETVDWLDPRWVALQRKREQWLGEFAALCTGTVRALRPEASVEHQASTYPLNWGFGVAQPLVEHNDFLQGDFTGDAVHGSFVRKLLSELTPNPPCGYETPFSTDMSDHTGAKSEELLARKAAAAIADHTAFIYIDAIDPIGTVNVAAHERMGKVFGRWMPCYQHLGGERLADVAVYFSLEAKFDLKDNGRHYKDVTRKDSHTEPLIAITRRLIAAHLPFTVITRRSLNRLGRFKVLILGGVPVMDEAEAEAIREFVRAGGAVYASGAASLLSPTGRLREDFLLGDVFGVTLEKVDWAGHDHYIAPTATGRGLFDWFTAERPAYAKGPGFAVRARDGAEVLATTTLPWPAPDGRHFSSFHSNPPWQPTRRPEIVFHRFGRGRAVYCATAVEEMDSLRFTFNGLIRRLNERWTMSVEAPSDVEVTLFDQPDRRRFVLTLCHTPAELPAAPVAGIRVLAHPPRRVSAVEELPSGRRVAFRRDGDKVRFDVPRLDTLSMFALRTG